MAQKRLALGAPGCTHATTRDQPVVRKVDGQRLPMTLTYCTNPQCLIIIGWAKGKQRAR